MNRGDVVIADLPFSDRMGSKIRPAVIVSTDLNNTVIDDIVLVAVSRFTRPAALTHVLIDPVTPDGKRSGLLHKSFVQCENIFTLDKKLVISTLGSLSATLLQQVNDCLKRALDIP